MLALPTLPTIICSCFGSYPEVGEKDITTHGCSIIPETIMAEKKQESATVRR
jgi:hypothetical protein